MRDEMVHVTLYTSKQCPLCEDAEHLLNMLTYDWDFQLNIVDIYEDDALLERYQLMIPVVVINEEEVDFGQVSKEKVEAYLKQIGAKTK